MIRIRYFASIVILGALLSACDTVQEFVYNMTSCPVEVTYSVGAIRSNKMLVKSGKSVGAFPAPPLPLRLEQLTIVDRDRVPHSYCQADLAKLRPSIFNYDRFGWFDDGLHWLPRDAKEFPAAGRACDVERIGATNP
jgi:hypothetical protein